MFVQNYESNTTNPSIPPKIERVQVPTTIPRKIPSVLRRSSIKSIDGNTILKQTFDNVDTQITTTERSEQSKFDANNQDETIRPSTGTTIDIKQQDDQSADPQGRLELADNRKRIKKGAFDGGESMNDLMAFELGSIGNNRGAMKKNRFRMGKANNVNGEGTEAIPENQDTLDLLEKNSSRCHWFTRWSTSLISKSSSR